MSGDSKISQLPVATPTAGTELVPVVQGGQTVQVPLNQALAPKYGASAVGADDGASGSLWTTVQGGLDTVDVKFANYTALRAYTGTRHVICRITTAGIAGFFYYDSTDVTSADNGGTVIVDASGRRWKRFYDGRVDIRWFGVIGNLVADDTASAALAIAAQSIGGFELAVDANLHLKITATLDMPPGLRIIGEGGAVQTAPSFVSFGGIPIFTARAGFGSESAVFENLVFDSNTPGTGKAFTASATSYISQTTWRNCVFKSNLAFGIDAPIIVNRFYDCDFGSYPGAVQGFEAIRSVGTIGSFEPNLNAFYSCVFRKSNAVNQIEIDTAGVEWNFYACDFEQNQCTGQIVRNNGAGSVKFFGGYIESNTTPYFMRVYGSLVTGFCNTVKFDGVHVLSPATSAILKREIAYPYLEITGCYGQLNCNVITNESGLSNQASDLEACYGNYFVAGTGSYGQLATVNTTTGYNARSWRVVSAYADAATIPQINGVQKLAVSVTVANTTICALSNPFTGVNWSGTINVTAMSGTVLNSGGAANTANYVLNVSNGGVTACTQISAAGVTGGAAANQPSFTWTISAGNLQASPIGATSGTFSFLISAMGCVAVA